MRLSEKTYCSSSLTMQLALPKCIWPGYSSLRALMQQPMSRRLSAPTSNITQLQGMVSDRTVFHLFGQEVSDNGDITALLRSKFQPGTFLEDLGRFLTLLDHLCQHLQDFLIRERVLVDTARTMSWSWMDA